VNEKKATRSWGYVDTKEEFWNERSSHGNGKVKAMGRPGAADVQRKKRGGWRAF